MLLIKYAGKETALPEMSSRSPFFIDVLGITHMKCVECPGERIVFNRDRHKMHVVSHETISPNLK